MGQSQGQQHTGRQYLSRPFPKRLAYFGQRSFQKSPFENVRFSAMAVFRQCPKVMIQKVMDFENQLIITSNCVLLLFQTHMHYHLPQYHYQHRHDNVMVIALPLVRYGLNQTQKRFKRAIFIRTRHSMRIFGIIPFSKLQNASSRFRSLFCCCCCFLSVCLFVTD